MTQTPPEAPVEPPAPLVWPDPIPGNAPPVAGSPWLLATVTEEPDPNVEEAAADA